MIEKKMKLIMRSSNANIDFMNKIDIGQEAIGVKGIISEYPKKFKALYYVIIDGQVYLNGYELLKDGSWKKTFMAFFYFLDAIFL